MATGQIAQLIVPSDGIGNPNFCIPDWARGQIYFLSSVGVRRYALLLETQSPALSVTWPASTTNFCAAVDPVSGCLIAQQGIGTLQNGDPLYKYDPTNLTLLATYGVSTASPSYPTSFWGGEGLVCVACGTQANPNLLVGYAFLKESAFQASIDGFRLDTFTASGFRQSVTAGAVNNRAIMCAGASGSTGASVYVTWNGSITPPSPTIPLQRIVVAPGAETYNIASWPTQNPHITISQIGTIAAASVDPTWTHLAAQGLTYDATDGNVLLAVYTTDSVTTKHYLIKVSGTTAAVLWASPILPNSSVQYTVLNASQVNHGTLGLISYSDHESQLATTSSGAITSAPLTGVTFNTTFGTTGGQTGSVIASDDAALFFVCVGYSGGGGAATPAPVSGTPSSFTGYGIIGGIIPAPPVGTDNIEIGDLWYGPTGDTFIDLRAQANRRKFIGVDGSTTFLGDNGELPIGEAPPIFLTLSAGEIADDWPNNKGTGGAFTRVGTDLQRVTSIPPCSSYTFGAPAFNSPQGADPQIMLSVSDDGGRTFSLLQKWRSVGKIGEYTKRIRWLKMGMFRQRQIRLEITDPVRRNIVGIYLYAQPGLD